MANAANANAPQAVNNKKSEIIQILIFLFLSASVDRSKILSATVKGSRSKAP